MRTLLSAVAIAALLAIPETRADTVMYGDWHADAPGVQHHITVAGLPQPYATRSVAHRSQIVPRPAGAAPVAPQGFSVTLWAEGFHQPRELRTAPDGSVFLAESGAGRVLRFTPDGHYAVFAADLHRPYGIAFWPADAPRFVYVADTDRVVRFPWTAGHAAAEGPAETVVPSLPTGGHWTRDLAVATDGSLLLAVGSSSNLGDLRGAPPGGDAEWDRVHGIGAAWGDDEDRADVLRLTPADGRLHPFAQGLRNCSGLGVQPGSGRVWCAVNERDGLGDNLPPDYVTRVTEGAFYGWPWFYIGDHPDPRLEGERADLANRVTVPDVLIQPHSAPLGIAFDTGTLFPPEYRGDAFVTLHGSWNRAHLTGYKVVRIMMKDGAPDGGYQDFLTGFVLSDEAVWGRPVGVTFAHDGALLVSEDGGGTIWRVAPAR